MPRMTVEELAKTRERARGRMIPREGGAFLIELRTPQGGLTGCGASAGRGRGVQHRKPLVPTFDGPWVVLYR